MVVTTALGVPAFATGCGDGGSGGASAPPVEQTEPPPTETETPTTETEPPTTETETPTTETGPGDTPTLDQEGPFGEYPYEECDDIDADGIPDGPWDCNKNGIPDEDEDSGFLP